VLESITLARESKEIEGLPIPDYKKRRPVETPSYYSYINVPIYASIAEEEAVKADVILHYHEFIADVTAAGDSWEITSLGRGIKRITKAKEIIDCTGDFDVVRILGLGVLRDKVRQPGAYQYKIEGIEYEQMWDGEVQTLYDEAMGAAAALAVKKGIPSREINVKDIVALTAEHGAVPI